MGYRSEVVIKVYGSKSVMIEVKEGYMALFNALDDETQEVVNDMVSAEGCNGFVIVDDDDCGEYTFYADYIKWYDDCPSVQFFNSVRKLAVTLGGNVEFVRIGEELDDNEEICEGDDVEYRVSITRTLSGY